MFSTVIRSAYTGVQNILNPAYRSDQSFNDFRKYGSRDLFCTDYSINGEYFRSKTKNEYFQMVDKDCKVEDLSKLAFFIPSEKLSGRLYDWGYDPKKHSIVCLSFSKYKSYFVENNQDIKVDRPDVIVLSDMEIEELLLYSPKFVNLPPLPGK